MSGLAAPYNDPTTAGSQTGQIAVTKARTRPDVAAVFATIFNAGGDLITSADGLAGNINTLSTSLDKYTYNFIRTIGSNQTFVSRGISSAAGGVIGGINDLEGFSIELFDKAGNELREIFKPVSTALGSTLGTLTGIAKDPLGSISMLPRTLADLVEKVNPGFAARMEGTYKKLKIDNLVHLPGQIIGSIRNLMTIADAVLSLPFIILADLYQGLQDILNEIADLIDKVIERIINFLINDVLGSIIPIGAIMEFLAAVSELASEVQGITTLFLGANPIAGFALDVQNYSRQITGFFTNPTNLLASYLPPAVDNALYTLRNPGQLINSILPPQIGGAFSQLLTDVVGVGFNGNMGYGFQAVLNTFARDGVIGSILNNFASQYKILTPLLGLTEGSPAGAAFPPLFKPSVVNPASHPVTHGVPQPQTPQPPPVGATGP